LHFVKINSDKNNEVEFEFDLTLFAEKNFVLTADAQSA